MVSKLTHRLHFPSKKIRRLSLPLLDTINNFLSRVDNLGSNGIWHVSPFLVPSPRLSGCDFVYSGAPGGRGGYAGRGGGRGAGGGRGGPRGGASGRGGGRGGRGPCMFLSIPFILHIYILRWACSWWPWCSPWWRTRC